MKQLEFFFMNPDAEPPYDPYRGITIETHTTPEERRDRMQKMAPRIIDIIQKQQKEQLP